MLKTIRNNLVFLKKKLLKQDKNIFYNNFLSNDYGDSRGTPITRYYIQHFFLNLKHPLIELIFLIGDFAEHVEARKVEKSCLPSKSFVPFFKPILKGRSA